MPSGDLAEFSERLAKEWVDLADQLNIKYSYRSKFAMGREPQEIVEWLIKRKRLSELIPALREIDRGDLIPIASNLLKRDPGGIQTESLDDDPGVNPTRSPIQVNLQSWADQIYKTDHQIFDRLLESNPFSGRREAIFQALDDFVRRMLEMGLSVEVVDSRRQAPEKLKTVEDLWVRVIVALVDDPHAQNVSSWKWLIRETVKPREDKSQEPPIRLKRIWGFILNRYCNHESNQYRKGLLTSITRVAFDVAKKERRRNFLEPFITYLFDNLKSDVLSVREITEILAEYDKQIGNNEKTAFLVQLKTLIGAGTNTATHGIEDIPPLDVQMTPIPPTELCNYEFEAMVYPLTVSEYSYFRGILPKNAGENAAFPYVFKVVSDEGRDIFNSFAAEVQSIVNRFGTLEADESYEWDVPTTCEWTVLSGCDRQRYPWGNDPPTIEHANFDFGERSKLSPVGAYPLGISMYGIYDCFGNAHEIVRSSFGNKFPEDFRLAGGCYQTNAMVASPRFIRSFRSKDEEDRQNIGLRLVRFRSVDKGKRSQALRRSKERQQ